MSLPLPPQPWPRRRVLLLLLAGVALGCCVALRLSPAGLWPTQGGLRVAGQFLAGAWPPAFDYEASFVPAGAAPFWQKVLLAAWKTVQLGAAGAGLSILVGCALGLAATRAVPELAGCGAWRCGVLRGVIALLRSTHELVWALLFLCAFGLTPLAAVLAIALPYSGTLAKIVSEMLEEAPRDAALLLRDTGTSAWHAVLLGLVPRVWADIVSYSLYRLECALRAAAVMGFIGVETLGFHLHQAFEVSHYHEVWSYLLVLLMMVAALDRWSAAIRARLPT